MAGPTPGAEAAQELYTELECEVFHELEQFVSDPHFVAALDRPSKEGKAGLLQRWTNWAHSGSKKVPTNAQNSEAGQPHASALATYLGDEPPGLEGGAADGDLEMARSCSTVEVFHEVVPSEEELSGVPSQEEFVMVEKQHAIEAMAFYIAACIMDMPESNSLTPKQLQAALVEALRSLKRSRFQKACSFGRRVYRWTTYTYSAVQVYQNPWLMRALLTALWATSRVSMRFLL